MGKIIKYLVIAAILILSGFGIYSFLKYSKVDENTLD
ncbi:hypothetical protein SAMN05720471_101228 [Fibrobacter sp. UWP2]|jgi:hypothetical protein|nr:hypothetical protein SAMN05720471_101228 [Fibrobacter sp. UWP2]